jgi:hypothetical protein
MSQSSGDFPRIPLDTTPEAYAAQIEAYRRMGGKERTAVMFRLNELARATAVAGIRARHPDYGEEQVRLALFRLILGDELTRAVWPGRELVDP